jgi:hypothetical protein
LGPSLFKQVVDKASSVQKSDSQGMGVSPSILKDTQIQNNAINEILGIDTRKVSSKPKSQKALEAAKFREEYAIEIERLKSERKVKDLSTDEKVTIAEGLAMKRKLREKDRSGFSRGVGYLIRAGLPPPLSSLSSLHTLFKEGSEEIVIGNKTFDFDVHQIPDQERNTIINHLRQTPGKIVNDQVIKETWLLWKARNP